MTTDDDLAELIATYPPRIEFVGGPYCGCYLCPHHQRMSDAHRDVLRWQNFQLVDASVLPNTWMPLSANEMKVSGPSGVALYRMESEQFWHFVGFFESVPADA